MIFKENFLRLVVNDGCHLCEEAEPVVRRVANRLRVPFEVVDMGTDDELVRLYAWRIPVVLGPDGDVLGEGIIDERRLRRTARRALKRS